MDGHYGRPLLLLLLLLFYCNFYYTLVIHTGYLAMAIGYSHNFDRKNGFFNGHTEWPLGNYDHRVWPLFFIMAIGYGHNSYRSDIFA